MPRGPSTWHPHINAHVNREITHNNEMAALNLEDRGIGTIFTRSSLLFWKQTLEKQGPVEKWPHSTTFGTEEWPASMGYSMKPRLFEREVHGLFELEVAKGKGKYPNQPRRP